MFISQMFLRNSDAPNNNGGGEEVKTDEQKEIDKRNVLRASQGLDALPYPNTPVVATTPVTSKIDQFREDKIKELTENNASGLTPEQITEEAEKLIRLEADRLKVVQEQEETAARLDAEKNGIANTIKISAKPVVVIEEKKIDEPVEKEIDEEAVLKFLSKKGNKEITSLDALLNVPAILTEEEKTKQVEERESNKLAYALHNKLISESEIKSFIEDTGDLESVAYNFYAAQQLNIDQSLTDEAIRESFEETYGLDDTDKTSVRYKTGQAHIDFLANNIIAKKHAKYLGLENQYSSFETTENKKLQSQKEILSKAPFYKRDVEAAAEKITSVSIAGYNIQLDKEIVDMYKNQMLDPDYTKKAIANGYSLDEIESAMRNSALIDNIESIVSGILSADRLKNQAGSRGVIPQKNVSAQNVLSEEKEAERKKLQERLNMQTN